MGHGLTCFFFFYMFPKKCVRCYTHSWGPLAPGPCVGSFDSRLGLDSNRELRASRTTSARASRVMGTERTATERAARSSQGSLFDQVCSVSRQAKLKDTLSEVPLVRHIPIYIYIMYTLCIHLYIYIYRHLILSSVCLGEIAQNPSFTSPDGHRISKSGRLPAHEATQREGAGCRGSTGWDA